MFEDVRLPDIKALAVTCQRAVFPEVDADMMYYKINMTRWLSISRHKHMKSVLGWTRAEVTGGVRCHVTWSVERSSSRAQRPIFSCINTNTQMKYWVGHQTSVCLWRSPKKRKQEKTTHTVLYLPIKTFSLVILPLRALGGTQTGNLWLMLLTPLCQFVPVCVVYESYFLVITWLSVLRCFFKGPVANFASYIN